MKVIQSVVWMVDMMVGKRGCHLALRSDMWLAGKMVGVLVARMVVWSAGDWVVLKVVMKGAWLEMM